MLAIVRRARMWRSVLLLVMGVAVGMTLVAPVAAQARSPMPKGSATIHERSASCSGYSFHPIESATTYKWTGTMIYRTYPNAADNGDGWFVCDAGLPDKAVVTKVQFTLRDGSNDHEVSGCALVRADLASATAGSYNVMATVPSTGVDAAPGIIRLTTTAIGAATVDDLRFGYWLQCQLPAATDPVSMGLYGADVKFTITTENG